MKFSERFGPFVMTVSLALLTVFICMQRYADYDLWWHLKLGEYLFNHLQLPSTDSFSYVASGQQQFTGEWLADAVIYLIFISGGFLGLNLFKAAILLTTFFLLYLRMRDVSNDAKVNVVAVVLTLLLVLFSGRFHLFARPYLFSLPMVAGFLYILENRHRYDRYRLLVLPLLMALWVNLSVGAIFGVFLVCMAMLSEIFQQRSIRLLPIFLLTALASLVNPETYRYFTYVLFWATDSTNALTGENQPISLDLLFGGGFWYTIWFQILAVGSIIGFIHKRGWKDFFQFSVFSFFLYEAFRHIRLVDLFGLAAAPYFFSLLLAITEKLPRLPSQKRLILQISIAIFIFTLIPLAVLNSRVYTFGVGLKESAFPEEAIRFLDEHKIQGRMFNSYGFGGYIIWRGGGRQVFIDGRYPRFYTPDQFGEYYQMMESAEAWRTGELKYGFDYAIIEYDVQSQRFPRHLLENPDWAIVYWDNQSIIFVRRLPKWAALIDAREYRVVQPKFFDFSYLDQFLENGRDKEILPLLDRDVALNPNNQFVALARIYFLYGLGREYFGVIRAELERIIRIPPDFAMKHSALAIILAATGAPEKARQELLIALDIDPTDPAALSLASTMGIEVKSLKSANPGHP
jgi:hypothetical protein